MNDLYILVLIKLLILFELLIFLINNIDRYQYYKKKQFIVISFFFLVFWLTLKLTGELLFKYYNSRFFLIRFSNKTTPKSENYYDRCNKSSNASCYSTFNCLMAWSMLMPIMCKFSPGIISRHFKKIINTLILKTRRSFLAIILIFL